MEKHLNLFYEKENQFRKLKIKNKIHFFSSSKYFNSCFFLISIGVYYSKFEIIRKYSFFYIKIEIYQMPFSLKAARKRKEN